MGSGETEDVTGESSDITADCGCDKEFGAVLLTTKCAIMDVDWGMSSTGAALAGLVALRKALSTCSLARNSSATCMKMNTVSPRGNHRTQMYLCHNLGLCFVHKVAQTILTSLSQKLLHLVLTRLFGNGRIALLLFQQLRFICSNNQF